MITESEFIAAADRTLAAIGEALDAALAGADVDLDWSLNDGILEIECDDGSKLIVNRHVPNREIWVAARSGGFHFAAARRWLARHALGRRARSGARALVRAQAGLTWRCRRSPAPDPRDGPTAPPQASSSAVQSSSARRRRGASPGNSASTRLQNRGEWLSSTRCATSCATMYSASSGGSWTSRQLSRITPCWLQLPHSERALDSLTRRRVGVTRAANSATRGSDQAQRLLAQPAGDERRDLPLVLRRRMQHGEVEEVGGDLPLARGMHGERQLAAEIEDRRAGLPLARQHVAPPRRATRRASAGSMRRARSASASISRIDTQRGARTVRPREADLHADRCAGARGRAGSRRSWPASTIRRSRALVARRSPPAGCRRKYRAAQPLRQLIGSRRVCRGARLRPRSTSRLPASASARPCPAGGIGLPIEIVTVPGRLPKTPFGHR